MRRLPLVLFATLAVLGTPLAAVTLLRATGAVTSFLPLAAAGAALSVVVSYAGAALWSARARTGETLFGELMIWGWLWRRRQERKLASAVRLLGLREGGRPAELGRARRVRLLEELASGLELRFPDTGGHSRRVARHAAAIARRMGLPRQEVDRIRLAAALHDVGKVETPAEIVNKPGALSGEELAAIKRHAAAGARMVAPLGDEELTRIVRHHHERLDGAGYPDGLAGTAIPLGARIVAVADSFDAITSNRPYRPARRQREALALLEAEAGAQLDAGAVAAFRGYCSGLRPVAAWATLLNGARGMLPSLAGQAKLGGVAAATTLAAVAVAGDVAPRSEAGEPAGQAGAAAQSGRLASSPASGGDPGGAESAPGGRAKPSPAAAGEGSGTGRGDATGPAEPSDGTAGSDGDGRVAQAPGPSSDGDGSARDGGRSTRDGGSGGDGGSGSDDGSGGDGGGEEGDRSPVREAVDTVDTAVGTVVEGAESTVDSTLDDPPLPKVEAPEAEAPLDLGR